MVALCGCDGGGLDVNCRRKFRDALFIMAAEDDDDVEALLPYDPSPGTALPTIKSQHRCRWSEGYVAFGRPYMP